MHLVSKGLEHIPSGKQQPYPMVKNMRNKQGVLRLYVNVTSMMYTLGDDEVPTITTSLSSTLKLQYGRKYRRVLSVRDIDNDPFITETTAKQRACRFHHENEGGLYPQYSYSACTVLCRKRAQLKMCQCNDHFMLNTTEEERCNITGMNCLNSMSKYLTALKPAWSQRPGLTCDCLPSCDEREITVINDEARNPGNDLKPALVEIILGFLPTERFKRNVVRSRLDLVGSSSLLCMVRAWSWFYMTRFVLFDERMRKSDRLFK
ncbi:unnamed protein product [Arctia plantaginis]|uniref:Uncharacterized protein n=1 Tax=Arctia plantaginis TaxID=874455 RepID=A0A8S1BQK4_ARCPL|nr:unnamed protein product [Arctia plantaginis]